MNAQTPINAEGRFQFFRPLAEDDFKALVRSIQEHGQQQPVLTLPNGEIIDGHHRHRACEELGIPCKTEVRDISDEAAESLAIQLNITSKNTPTYVRAFGAARMVQRHGGDRKSKGPDGLLILSELWSVPEKTIKRARRILTQGSALLVAECEGERITIAAAERVAAYFSGQEDAEGAIARWLDRNADIGARSRAAQSLRVASAPLKAPAASPKKIVAVADLEALADGELGGFSSEHSVETVSFEPDDIGDALTLISTDDQAAEPVPTKASLDPDDARKTQQSLTYANDLKAYAAELHGRSARSCLFGMEEAERRQFIRDVAAAKSSLDALADEIVEWGSAK